MVSMCQRRHCPVSMMGRRVTVLAMLVLQVMLLSMLLRLVMCPSIRAVLLLSAGKAGTALNRSRQFNFYLARTDCRCVAKDCVARDGDA